MKKVLWVLAIVVSVVFIISGGQSFLSGRGKNIIGTINGQKITLSDFGYYIKMAQLYFLLYSERTDEIGWQDIETLAWDFLLLAKKAKQEKITVDDQEVVKYITKSFASEGKFDKSRYTNYLDFLSKRYSLGLTPRGFEEYMRGFIKRDKLFQKYVKTEVTEEEAKDLYKKETQKAKIDYLFIPYEKFEAETEISENEINEFYEKNKTLFLREPKVNIRYILISDDDSSYSEIVKALPKAKALSELKDKFSLQIKEVGFIALGDPIEEIGWQPQINKIAFSLKKNELSPLIQTEKGIMVMEVTAEQPASVPPLNQIKTEVKEKIISERAKEDAKKLGQTLLDQIKKEKIKNLKKAANKENIEFKKTDHFKFYDYIDGLGLDHDENTSQVIFSLKPNQIHSEILALRNGAYIIQLKEITPFDEEGFGEKKQTYLEQIKQSKEMAGKIKFLIQLKEETNLKRVSQQ